MLEARAVASALVFRAFLPPHPALSLGEGTPHPASLSRRASLLLAPCAPRFEAETHARPSALDSPRSGERFSPLGDMAAARSPPGEGGPPWPQPPPTLIFNAR